MFCFIQKFEDTELDLEPLPEMKIVPTPDGLPNELFGDVAMVTEFISCYQGLLIPNKEFPVSAGKYMYIHSVQEFYPLNNCLTFCQQK